MEKAAARWGATPEEWAHFDVNLGLTEDILPVVSNPHAPISGASTMKALGKTPSRFNRQGEVVGFGNWTEYRATVPDLMRWSKCADYGICIQTREVRCGDVDVEDNALAQAILDFICARYKFPIRTRPNSAKFLFAFRVKGEIPKRVMKLETGMIEWLGNGQQFIACGTHSSGVRYEWDWQGLEDFPEMSLEEYQQLQQELFDKFAIALSASGALRKARVDGTTAVSDDPVASFLQTIDLFLGVARDGKILIDCPWKDNHSTDNGETQTTYMPPGDRDYKRGHFKCLHAGCADKKDADFLEAVGYNDVMFEPLPEEPVAPGKAVRKPLPAFGYKNDKIEASLHNLSLALERPDVCRVHLRTDTFRDEVMYAPMKDLKAWRPLRDADQVHLRQYFEQNKFNPIGRELMRDAILAHADTYEFDSAIEWLTTEVPEWDGVPRIETFFIDYCHAEDTPYIRAVASYLWTAMAGRVLSPGVKADMVPILVGAQGIRKSSLVAALVPDAQFFVEVNLNDKDDNLARLMRGKLVAEIGELRGLHSRDLESNKAFVARQHESWVPKYREFATKYPRRLVFIGTTNQEEFLADDTGNRRWLPISVKGTIDTETFIANRDQFWAEARELYRAEGIDWSAERLAADVHERHMIIDVWQGEVERWLDTPNDLGAEGEDTPRGRGFFTTMEAADGALSILAKNCKRSDEMRLGAIFRKLGFKKMQKRVNGVPKKGWGP